MPYLTLLFQQVHFKCQQDKHLLRRLLPRRQLEQNTWLQAENNDHQAPEPAERTRQQLIRVEVQAAEARQPTEQQRQLQIDHNLQPRPQRPPECLQHKPRAVDH